MITTMTNRYFTWVLLAGTLSTISCTEDDTPSAPAVEAPDAYSFTRNGQSTVSFTGQTQRIMMATELAGSMKSFDEATEASLLEMYRNEAEGGGDVAPFTEASLNETDKSIREKVAASRDYFSANATEGVAIKNQFEDWITRQVAEVFPNEEVAATPGVAGQIANGTRVRYVSEQGLEYDQLVSKGLIGALMVDQILNNYLSAAVLDEGDSRAENDAETPEGDAAYTYMEHRWDEAYGYAYGASADPANPNLTIGEDDSFLNEYIGQVSADPDFSALADNIFDAFTLGRAAIVAGNYTVRDQQAEVIRENISQVPAVRGVFYLQRGKEALEQSPDTPSNAFHALSEAYGFIYSLQFTRQPGTDTPYFSGEEVTDMLNTLLGDGANGLWDVTPETLDALSSTIADRFGFTVEQAGSTEGVNQ